MAEEKKPQKNEKHQSYKDDDQETLVRIYGCDLKGSKSIYVGLTKIKGISWPVSNIICKKLSLNKATKVADLKKPEIETIEKFLNNLEMPDFMKNRRNDRETGKTAHLLGTNIDMKREFDIKHLKAIKSYKGIRHSNKLPVRGQRTRANFRAKKVASGTKRNKK
ncbi:30S ribosomal protein S13 [Candidatus Pacearchaeota archaeon CG10_big_fil_rev_8_21_14_0_10_31_24]|nr:MAG: 30S ribosomal protein S13 [Candidatus Pacearchaeota archaeon CG10_big_fil_rev_8_21_14_0_10_31_24]